MTGESVVKVCAVQMEPKLNEKEWNVQKTLEKISEAADNGAKLIVLPEMCTTGYQFDTRKEVYALAERIPEGNTVQRWIRLARERAVYIAAGIMELGEDGVRCYNSAVLIGPDGYIGKHRKLNLIFSEKMLYEPGDLGYQVFYTPIGRIGLLICFDMWFPENFRLLALKGADIVCCPANWPGPRTFGPYVAMVHSNANNLFVVAADRVGTEKEIRFAGQSLITGQIGWPAAGPASETEEELLYAELNLMDARRLNRTETTVVFRDRRTDLYDEALGSGENILPR